MRTVIPPDLAEAHDRYGRKNETRKGGGDRGEVIRRVRRIYEGRFPSTPSTSNQHASGRTGRLTKGKTMIFRKALVSIALGSTLLGTAATLVPAAQAAA